MSGFRWNNTPRARVRGMALWQSFSANPDAITRRKPLIVTLALLGTCGNSEEISMHVRASQNTETSPKDLLQAIIPAEVYAGVPKVNHAIKLAKQTYADLGVEI